MTPGQWVFFSLPCMPPDSSASNVFTAGPVPGEYNSTWFIYSYDSAAEDYTPLAANEDLVEGKGYLFYTVNTIPLAEVAGEFNTGAPMPLLTGPDPGKWHLVGNPFTGPVDWTSINVHDGNKSHSWAKMDEKKPNDPNYGCEQTPNVHAKCIMWHVMNKLEGTIYVPYDGFTDEPGQLAAFDAMWVLSHRSVTITMTESASAPPASMDAAPVSNDTGESKAPKNNKGGKGNKSESEWSVRLIAESGSNRDAGNRLGQAQNASDGLDSRDLEEWTPFGSPYLSILFTNPLFDEVDWGYTTDYRELTRSQQGEWSFVVRASAGIDEVTLSWEGDTALFSNAVLTNEVNGEIITIVPGGSYSFNMSGDEHPFTIVFN